MRLTRTLTWPVPTPWRTPMAVAVGLALGGALPAQAQSFTQSGANSTSGNPSGLPFVGNPASLDFGTDAIYIGNSAPGSFSALAGAQLTAGALSIANGGVPYVPANPGTGDPASGSWGNVTFGGAGTAVTLTGTQNRLEVGNWGTGTLTVSGGALVDAASAPCASGCGAFIGNGAGSTGTLNITGVGSEVRTLGISIGQSSVFTNPPNAFVFGTPGGTTNAVVNVLAGGKLTTERATVGSNNGSPNGNGSEKAFGTLVIDGANSQWLVKNNSLGAAGNQAAGLTIGNNAGGEGTVTVTNGGKLRIDGTDGPGPNDFINIASNGGKGTLTVSGAGSSVDVVGVNTVLQVGRAGAGAQGSFSVLVGASASALYINVGRDGASGMMAVDGSSVVQSGVGSNQSPGVNGPAFTHIGRDGGSGTAVLSNGGTWLITDGGGDGRTSVASPGVALGRGANASGSLTITGAGSRMEITSSSINPAPGSGDNYNPFFAVGFDNAATTSGTLTVSDGGKLVMTGNALSTVANSRVTQLAIGGRSGTAGTGTATVTGAGSEIVLQGSSALINVGREAGGNGTLNVLAGGKVSSTSMAVGISGTGTVNIDNAWIALSGTRTDTNPLVGAGTTIGRGAGGNGTLNMSNGARLTIDPTVNTSGMSVGGDTFLDGGTGTVTMSGGSSIVFGGPLSGNAMSIGRTGNGTVGLSTSSFIDVGSTASVDVGRSPGGVGVLNLLSGSKLKGGDVNFGGNSDTAAGGNATVTVSGTGSEIAASGDLARVLVGRGGTGTLNVDSGGKITAKNLTVGRAAGGNGTLNADNATINLSGEQFSGGNYFGAALSVGNRGGNGTATINNSTVTITNNTATGAALNVGGSAPNPTGTGVLNLTGGTTVDINAAAGLGSFNVGYNGNGTANINNSTVNVNDGGAAYVGRQAATPATPGSPAVPAATGVLNLSNGAVLNAGFVGVGVSSAGTGKTLGTAGGTGTVDLGDLGTGGTINAPRFELGYGSLLKGSGTINAGPGGEVVIGGTVDIGHSPGRIIIRCDVTMLLGSQLILEIDGTGGVVPPIDQLVIGSDSTFDLTQLKIIFAFVGDTNPESVNLDLSEFLRTDAPGGGTTGLEALFGKNGNAKSWGSAVNSGLFAFQSSYYDVTSFEFNPETGQIGGVDASAIPEPATYALVLLALGLMVRGQRRATARRV